VWLYRSFANTLHLPCEQWRFPCGVRHMFEDYNHRKMEVAMVEVKFTLIKKLNHFPKAHWYSAFVGTCADCRNKTLQYLGRDDKGHHYVRCQCKAAWEIKLTQ
jgi:hypothetical protein